MKSRIIKDLLAPGFGPSRLAEMVRPRNVWAESSDGGPAVLIADREALAEVAGPTTKSTKCISCSGINNNPNYKQCDCCRARKRQIAYQRSLAIAAKVRAAQNSEANQINTVNPTQTPKANESSHTN